ncbi:MAG: radical SAM protein, partial [Calditerrivibrio sp.]|nr:radical SAM protein [Calditerrivibrio sp.]
MSDGKDLQSKYVDLLLKEINAHKGKKIDTIYIGGGTPSLLDIHDFKRLLNGIYKYFNVEVTEFTVEMNPESVSVEKLKCFHEAKVTRVSLGVQSMDD